MADNDVQLDLKKRSRRRLVGASALALAAAIILPMVMDREPKPAANELQIRIPGQEGSNFAQRMITGAAPPPVSPALPAAAQSIPLRSTAQSSPVAASAPASAPAAQQSHPQDVKPVAVQSAPVRPEPAASKPAANSKPPSDAQRAREILEGKPEAAKPESSKPQAAKPEPKEAAAQKFYVQLGVFRDEANAREVLNKAGSAGVKASAVKAQDRTRLRAGPFADRSAADTVVAKLKKAGLNGIVTNK